MKNSKIMKRVISAFAWKMMIPDMGKALIGMRKERVTVVRQLAGRTNDSDQQFTELDTNMPVDRTNEMRDFQAKWR
ncbi:hypothetical protein [Collimonas sp. OK242]|jgi:hypothetical protein|uniref:hypothetical protein n=1 Tax=Collimonas sp. OK242 TaxID=1798195 RepID=UPI00115FF577|nr:hypothetical protein [Collimonas sp. OK242]